MQGLTDRIILFLPKLSKEQEAACSYPALQFAPVKSQCLAMVDLHSGCTGQHQLKPKFLNRARPVIQSQVNNSPMVQQKGYQKGQNLSNSVKEVSVMCSD